jgi:hypothetical protein
LNGRNLNKKKNDKTQNIILSNFNLFFILLPQLSNENELEKRENVINEFKDLDLYKIQNWDISQRNDSLFIF